jgi:hypothetical protein
VALAGCAVGAQGQVIGSWNEALIDATRAEPLAGPGFISRAGAMLHLSMYNAVNALNPGQFESYEGFSYSAPANTSGEAAAATAANLVLKSVLPVGQHAALDARLASELALIADPVARMNGIDLGTASAAHMIGLRAGDGSAGPMPYTPGPNPGDWQPTQAGNPVHPGWGNVTPFGLNTGDQFRPTRFDAYASMADFLASPEWAAEYNEVKDIGRIDRWTPADEEYQIAFFWGNDRDGTSKPPGQLNQITQAFADQAFGALSPEDRLQQEARLFGLVNLALADAGVAAWDAKYNTDFDLWRPITAIQNGGTDGNAATDADPTWEPLNNVDPDGAGPLSADPFSPQFPAWVSGHATFGAAHAGIMAAFFGSDSFSPMLFGTDDPYVPGLQREFSSWSDMAWENALSRLYLGVHYRIDAIDGNDLGFDIAKWTFDNYLRLIPAPSTAALLGVAVLGAARRRRG